MNSMPQKRLIIAFILMLFAAWAPAAPEQGGRGSEMGDWFNPAAMRERLLNLYKEKLEVTDDEWTVLAPRLQKVMDLNQKVSTMTAMIQWNVLIRPRIEEMMKQNRANPMAGMMNMFIDRVQQERQKQAEDADEMEEAVQTSLTELQETLEKPAPSSAEIRNQMMAFRGAKEKLRQELAQAQKELTELLTLKQEALLLMMGILE